MTSQAPQESKLLIPNLNVKSQITRILCVLLVHIHTYCRMMHGAYNVKSKFKYEKSKFWYPIRYVSDVSPLIRRFRSLESCISV